MATYEVTVSGTSFAVSIAGVGQQGVPGANWRGVWALSTDYAVNDVVSNDGSAYICILAHTSASTDEPGVGVNTATYWAILAQGGADGTDGDGFTGGSYNAGTGVVTFTSDDGLGFSTGDLRGADGLTVNWQGDWAISTAFALNDSVAHNGSSYICIQPHTSSATDEPGVGANTATYWGVLAEKGADGAGTGTVTSIDITGGTGITSTGGPVTSSGAITVALDSATQASLALADSAQQPPAEGAFVNGDKTKLDGIEAGADVTDTANVTAAGALMDSEVTNLAAVKAFDPADYATAAQGATADTALQPAAIGTTVQAYSAVLAGTTASFTTADETKLDGIEAGATADQTGAEIKTALFAEADTNNLTDVLLSKLNGIEAGADVTDTANVTAAGALMDSEVDADIKTLSLPANTTISTFGASLVDDADAATARTTLGLGTAATTASTAYATAAQGALADSAVQPGDVETADLNAQTGTTYTLAIGDRGQVVTMNNANANTVTIPTNASVAFDVGSVVTVIQIGAGVTTVSGATGVTVNGTSGGSVSISAQYQGVSLLKIATDTWIASGAI